MIIERVAEHSFCPELMPEGAKVLDLGCRGFEFSIELARRGYKVYPVDIDILENAPMKYYRFGIGQFDGQCSIIHSKDPQATRMTPGFGIPMFTLPGFSKHVSVYFWDLIKIDVESSESEIILSLINPPARQISCEFHCHTGAYSVSYVEVLVSKLESIGYTVLQHKLERQHGCSENYWDSLFYLK